MSVMEQNVIDASAITDDKNGLVLMISDHLDWKNEYEHLFILQNKLNAYINFCETKQYSAIYKNSEIQYAVFEIHFLHEPTSKAIKFLNQVQEQVGELGIKIKCILS